MKKLLSMIGAMTLIGTASTGVVACYGGETPNTKPDERTDIENKITSPIALGQLSANTKVDFLAKLQTALARIPNLNTITPSDYDVYKAGTTTAIQDSDISAGTSLNIKIVAKDSSKNFKGIKDNIEINYTKKDTRIDLNTIITNTSLDKIVMLGTIPNKIELLNAIKENNPNASTLTENEFDFENNPNDTTATIKGTTNYKGKVTLTYQKDTRIDLNTITQLTGLDITADIQKTYNDLWTEIFKANEFKDLNYDSYETFMYKTNNLKDTHDIKQLNQEKGYIFIILQIRKNEGINCFGDTPRLKVTLK